MKLEMFDKATMTIRVSCDDLYHWEILDRLSSLITVSVDCGFNRIIFEPPRRLPLSVGLPLRQLARRNGVELRDPEVDGTSSADDFGFVVLSRESGFIFLRDAANPMLYRLYLEASEENVDLGARLSYLLANVLGFTSIISFETRFGVYELLNNVMEHGLNKDKDQWVELRIEKKAEKLSVSLVDRGISFDPTPHEQFNLSEYLQSGKKRGLGLIMTHKIAGKMQYERDSGFNRTSFEKTELPGADARAAKEDVMTQFTVGEPVRSRDGSYLIKLEGDLDTKGALVMEELMNQLLENKMFRVTFDFEKVPFVSSAGVGILLSIVSSLREESGEVMLLNVSPKVRSVFKLLNLDDYFTIVDSPETIVEF